MPRSGSGLGTAAASSTAGVTAQTALDFNGRDPVAAGFDEVVGPTLEPEKAVVIPMQDISRDIPFAAKDLGGLLGLVPVPGPPRCA